MADDLILKVGADTSSAEKALKTFTGDLKAFAGIAAGIFAGSKLTGFLTDAASAAIESDKSIRKVNIALASTGDFSTEAAAKILEFTGAIASAAGVSGEAVNNAFALAKSFNLTNEEAKKVTEAALDLSAATGKDLDTSVKSLAVTFNGMTGPLGKTDAAVKNLTKSQLEQGAAIDIVAGKYRGSAASAADTFAGNLNHLEEKLGDVSKGIGYVIIQNPVFQDAMREMAHWVTSFSNVIETNRDTLVSWTNKVIGAFGYVSSFVTTSISVLITPFSKITETLQTLEETLNRFRKAKGIDTSGGLSNVLTGLNGIVSGFKGRLDGASDSAIRFALKMRGINTAVDESAKGIKNQGKAVRDTSDALEELKGGYDKARQALSQLIDENAKKGLTALDYLEEQERVQKRILSDAIQEGVALGKSKKVLDEMAESFTLQLKIKKQIEARDILRKEEEDRVKRVTDIMARGTKNPMEIALYFGASDGGVRKQLEEAGKAFTNGMAEKLAITANDVIANIAVGGGIVNAVIGGKEGARKLISGAAAAAADAFLPGLGAAVGPLIDALGQGPEAVRGMVQSFTDGFVETLKNIPDAIPVFIEELVGHMDEIVGAMVENWASMFANPEFVAKIAKAFVRGLSRITTRELSANFKETAREISSQWLNHMLPSIKSFGVKFNAEIAAFPGRVLNGLVSVTKGVSTQAAGIFRDKIVGAVNNISDHFKSAMRKAVGDIYAEFFRGIKQIEAALTNAANGFWNAISGFFTTLADTVTGFFNQLGVLLESLGLNDLFSGMQTAASSITDAANDLYENVTSAATDFFETLKNLPQAIIDGIKDGIKGATGGGKKVIGGTLGDLASQAGKKLGLAGGADIPARFKGDRFGPVNLDGGEAVITAKTTTRLNDFLDRQEHGGQTAEILLLILAEIKKGQTIEAAIQIGSEKLGKANLNLRRLNKRTA